MTSIEELSDNGFWLAKAFVPDDTVVTLTAGADSLVSRFADGFRSPDFWCYDGPNGSPILYRVHNLEAQGVDCIAELFHNGPLHSLASSLLGARARSTVCAMVVKTKGVAGVPWHRDREDVPPGAAVNLSLYLEPSDARNGCFEAVPASHRLPTGLDVEAVRAAGPRVRVPAAPGDVLVHDVRLVHGSGDNPAGIERRSVIIEFVREDGAL